MSDIRRQELYCHSCGRYVQFDMDLELDGKHVLQCPNCKHEHCRIVRKGVITEERWDQRNGKNGGYAPFFIGQVSSVYQVPVHQVATNSITSTTASTFQMYQGTTANGNDAFLYGAWMDSTAVGNK